MHRGFPSSAGESVNVRILSRSNMRERAPSGRVDREEGNALVGTSPPMMDPYSARVNAPRIRPRNESGVGGRDALSFSLRTRRIVFGTFHLLTETLRMRRRVIALSDPIDSTLPKIATSNRQDGGNGYQSTKILDTARKKTVRRRGGAHLAPS